MTEVSGRLSTEVDDLEIGEDALSMLNLLLHLLSVHL